MKKIFFSILMTSLAITGLFAQKKVNPLPVDSTFAYGKEYIIYALPQTAFQVNVTVTRSHEFAVSIPNTLVSCWDSTMSFLQIIFLIL